MKKAFACFFIKVSIRTSIQMFVHGATCVTLPAQISELKEEMQEYK